jgi:hypothetical protein
MRGGAAATLWSLRSAGLHESAYCPSSITPSSAFGVEGNRLGQTEVVQISDQRQLHL